MKGCDDEPLPGSCPSLGARTAAGSRRAGPRCPLGLEPLFRRTLEAARAPGVGADSQPLAYPSDHRPDPPGAVRRGQGVCRPGSPPCGRARRDTERSHLVCRAVPEAAGRSPVALSPPGRGRLLQHGVRPHRGPPHLQRGAGHSRRGLSEGGQRPGRARSRGRHTVAAGLLPAGPQRRRASRSSSFPSTTRDSSPSPRFATAEGNG